MSATSASPLDRESCLVRAEAAVAAKDGAAAADAFRAALAVDVACVPAWLGLAKLQLGAGRLPAALNSLGRARELAPENPAVHEQLAYCALATGDAIAAEKAVREAISQAGEATTASMHGLLAETLRRQFRQREALGALEEQVARDPENHGLDSGILFQRNYFEWPDAHAEFRRIKLWNERHARKLRPEKLEFANDRDPNRRLRIGYVSPDFRWHAVAHFAQPVLAAHDRGTVEIFCYANHAHGDLNSRRFEKLADHWVMVRELSDEALAERIRADRIDLLVDLAGHSAHHRLLAFARKPAPVQVAWLGYCNTTGLSAIDYRMVDAIVEPPGLADEISAEKIVRLSRGFHCFAPPEENPPVRPSPAARGEPVTFGSFNNARKHTPNVIALWCEVLRAVPGSRILLKSNAYADAATKLWFLRRFAEGGVDAMRVRLIGSTTSASEHWSSFGLVDIALDPFPYNGTTTTCDALWMGVPVVTLEGSVHRARVGSSLLRQIGRADWIAKTAGEYVATATRLAHEAKQGEFDRVALREAMRGSALCDARSLAGELEQVYRRMWQGWVS